VLSATINHYAYITARYLPPFFPEKSRIVWSMIEAVRDHADIIHPSVRGVLKHLGIEKGIEIHHTGDLPARSGLGSSSAFTVGLLNALHALQGKMPSKSDLAREAIHVEHNVMRENVGIQDQIATTYGGLNRTIISGNGEFRVEPVILPQATLKKLERYCLLFFTGVSRTASDIAAEQIKVHASGKKDLDMKFIQLSVDDAIRILQAGDIDNFGKLLDGAWKIKRELAKNIAPQFVNNIYDRAIKAGALGGKLLGAGGGGFMLFIVRPENQSKVLEELKDLLWVPFKFEHEGSHIIFCDRGDEHGFL
jgi:D-glycero-alpha-D-manno-heptose-7-phosphate kinase